MGREARAEFDEPHAGVVYFDYQQKKFLARHDGRGRRSFARLHVSPLPDDRSGQRAPADETSPPDYDRADYLGYFDDLQAGRLAGPKTFKPGRGYNPAHFDTLVRALSVTEIPNRKTDVNINPRPLGFPFPEENARLCRRRRGDAAADSRCDTAT